MINYGQLDTAKAMRSWYAQSETYVKSSNSFSCTAERIVLMGVSTGFSLVNSLSKFDTS
jgi:hypothetical protein